MLPFLPACRETDLEVNPVREKKLSNVRSSGADERIVLTPPRLMTLEDAIGWVGGWVGGWVHGRLACLGGACAGGGPGQGFAGGWRQLRSLLPPSIASSLCPHLPLYSVSPPPSSPPLPPLKVCWVRRADRGDALQAAPAQAHPRVQHAPPAEAEGGLHGRRCLGWAGPWVGGWPATNQPSASQLASKLGQQRRWPVAWPGHGSCRLPRLVVSSASLLSMCVCAPNAFLSLNDMNDPPAPAFDPHSSPYRSLASAAPPVLTFSSLPLNSGPAHPLCAS